MQSLMKVDLKVENVIFFFHWLQNGESMQLAYELTKKPLL